MVFEACVQRVILYGSKTWAMKTEAGEWREPREWSGGCVALKNRIEQQQSLGCGSGVSCGEAEMVWASGT